jgi:hypothetical protein
MSMDQIKLFEHFVVVVTRTTRQIFEVEAVDARDAYNRTVMALKLDDEVDGMAPRDRSKRLDIEVMVPTESIDVSPTDYRKGVISKF